jgi:hypothetical protein
MVSLLNKFFRETTANSFVLSSILIQKINLYQKLNSKVEDESMWFVMRQQIFCEWEVQFSFRSEVFLFSVGQGKWCYEWGKNCMQKQKKGLTVSGQPLVLFGSGGQI